MPNLVEKSLPDFGNRQFITPYGLTATPSTSGARALPLTCVKQTATSVSSCLTACPPSTCWACSAALPLATTALRSRPRSGQPLRLVFPSLAPPQPSGGRTAQVRGLGEHARGPEALKPSEARRRPCKDAGAPWYAEEADSLPAGRQVVGTTTAPQAPRLSRVRSTGFAGRALDGRRSVRRA